MRERPENFKAADEDPEQTLVSPRFDANDARRAHPVVPLAEAPTSAAYADAPRARRVRTRPAWTTALLAIVLLVVAAVGGALVTNVMRSPRTEQVQEQPQTAPAQTVEAPPTQPSTPAPSTSAEAPREDATAAKPATRDTRTRRTQTAAAEPAVATRVREEFDDDDDDDRRGRSSEKRREHEERREEKSERQMRKASKREKGKEPRLVDVLTRP